MCFSMKDLHCVSKYVSTGLNKGFLCITQNELSLLTVIPLTKTLSYNLVPSAQCNFFCGLQKKKKMLFSLAGRLVYITG